MPKANALKTINKIARTLKRKHPSMKHTAAIRQASAIYRKDHRGSVGKTKRVSKKTSNKRKDIVRKVKRLHSAEGKAIRSLGSIATTKRHLKKQIEEKLAWGMLQQHTAKTKGMKRKIGKKLLNYKRELRSLTYNL